MEEDEGRPDFGGVGLSNYKKHRYGASQYLRSHTPKVKISNTKAHGFKMRGESSMEVCGARFCFTQRVVDAQNVLHVVSK